MPKKRIQVYADARTHRRIGLAAARRDVPLTQYCLEAITQKLAEDDVLEREQIEIPVDVPPRVSALADTLRRVHQRIKTRRNGKIIDVDRHLDRLREERQHDIGRLR